MLIRTRPTHRLCRIALLLIATSGYASAQYFNNGLPQKDGNGVTLNAQLVKTGLYVFSSSEGGNSLLRLSANGLILVNGQPPAYCDALRKRATKISKQPIRALILTDPDASHAECNAKFSEGGTRIVAQQNIKQNLPLFTPPGGAAATPPFTYDREYKLRLGGVEVQLFHFGNAHTSGDTVVYFPYLNVVAVGDLYAPTPNPDFSAGGSLVGWGAVLAEILKLNFDVVVPAQGPGATRADLETYKAKIDTVLARAHALVEKGVPKDQLMAQLKTDDLGWQFNFTGDQLELFYAELSRTK